MFKNNKSKSTDIVDEMINSKDLEEITNLLSTETEELTKKLKTLEKYSHQLKIVGDMMPDGFVIVNHLGKIEVANKSFREMFKIEKSQCIDQTPNILSLFDSKTGDKIDIKELFNIPPERSYKKEFIAQRNDQSYFDCQITFSVFERNEQFGFIFIFEDITQRVKNTKILNSQNIVLKKRVDILNASSAIANLFLNCYINDIKSNVKEALEILAGVVSCDKAEIILGEINNEGIVTFTINERISKKGYDIVLPDIGYINDLKLEDKHPKIHNLFKNKKSTIIDRKTASKEELNFLDSNIERTLMVPLFRNQLVWGWLKFDQSKDEKGWTAEELSSINIAAAVISSSLENERLNNKIYKHRAEIKYRKDRYDQIVDSVQEGMIMTNSSNNGIIVFVNDYVANVLECDIEELIGLNYKEFIHSEYLEQVTRTEERLLKEEKSERINHKIKVVSKKGNVISVNVSCGGAILRDDGSKDIIYTWTYDENTVPEYDNNQRYKTTFDKASIGYYIIDPNNNLLIEANDSLANILGYDSKNDLIGMHITQFLKNPNYIKNEIPYILNGSQSEIMIQQEFIAKDGSTVLANLLMVSDSKDSVLIGEVKHDEDKEHKLLAYIVHEDNKTGYIMTNISLDLIYANKKFKDLLSLDYFKSNKINLRNLAKKEDINKYLHDYVRKLNENPYYIILNSPKGASVPVYISFRPIRGSDNKKITHLLFSVKTSL